MTEKKLTDKQQAFINEYLKCWNATEAARLAGYSGNSNTLGVTGHDNLRNPKIAEEIKRRVDETTMSTDEALLRLSKQARTTMADFVKIIPGANIPMIDWETAQENGALDCVKEITIEDGKITFKLYDAQSAITQIIKQRQLLENKPTERVEYTLTEQERTERIATLLESARARRDGRASQYEQ